MSCTVCHTLMRHAEPSGWAPGDKLVKEMPHAAWAERCLTLPCCMQIIVAERGPLVFVFNFSPFSDYEGYKVTGDHSDTL